MLLALCTLLNTVFGSLGFPCGVLSVIGGISLLPLLFLYLASYVFRFCIYHRMFLHYILAVDVVNLVDFYVGIPINNRLLFGFYLMITGVFLFLILYYYKREK